MPRPVVIVFLLLPALFLTACAHKRPTTALNTGDSIEFRLQCVESSLMEMQRQQERDRQYIASLESKLRSFAPPRPAVIPPNAMALPSHTPVAPGKVVQPSVSAPPAAKPKAAAPKPAAAAPKHRTPVAKASKRQATKKSAASQTPVRSTAKTTPSGNGSFQRGMALIKSGKQEKGRALLRTFLADHPGSKYAPEASFAIGQTYFNEAVYDSAILAYKDVAGNHPSHPQAPQAMLQIGLCYEHLADPSNARFYLQALVDEYPASKAAEQAKKLLAKLSVQSGKAS